jgi:hypothetical protein
MLRARLAYTIARHWRRCWEGLAGRLREATRRNEARDFPAVSGDRHFLAVLDQVE